MNEYLQLLGLVRPHRLRVVMAGALLLGSTALNLAVPGYVGQLVDSVFGRTGSAQLNRLALVLAAILVARMALNVLSSYLLEWTGERIVADLRRALFARLIHFDLRFYADTRLGEITSRMTNDVAVIQSAVTTTLVMVVERALLVLGALGLMLILNWRLTLAIFVTTPLVVLLSRWVGQRVRRLSREAQDRLAAATGVMEETLGAIRVVKLFVREPHEIARFNAEVEGLFDRVRARARLSALYSPLSALLFLGALIFVLWLAGREVLAGRLQPGQMLQFLLYAVMISTSIASFTGAYNTFKRAIGATERVWQLLEHPLEPGSEGGGTVPPLRGALRFEGVSFAYDAAHPVLKDISFQVEPGEVVALVGASGVGKSTLFDLIARFYDVSEGHVLVDGVDVREWSLPALRAAIASVPQDTILFADTVRANLLYGRLDANEQQLRAAARAANADEFVRGLPLGYESIVGERGVKLSGGQRQRVAIGRALLKEPIILLLDEATSALDSESERLVQAALDELLAARGRTTLVIAHRLSTIRNADRILVFGLVDGVGRLVEQGSHEALVARGGVYQRMLRLQWEASRATPSEATPVEWKG